VATTPRSPRSQIPVDKRNEGLSVEGKISKAYLTLDSTGFIVALSSGVHATNTDATIPCLNTTSLGQVVLTLLLPNLDLLFLTATAELIGLELASGLELRPAVFGDIAFRHGEYEKS
jgi:hypothetical protein